MIDTINILPLVEGVMVDYYTREKISHSGKRISPEMKSRVIFFFQSVVICFFIILNASSKEDFVFVLESVNQWDTLCTYHYLNKATTTNISTNTGNIFFMVGYNCFIIFQYYHLNIKI